MKPTKTQKEIIDRVWSEHLYEFKTRRCSCGSVESVEKDGVSDWEYHVTVAVHEALLKSRL